MKITITTIAKLVSPILISFLIANIDAIRLGTKTEEKASESTKSRPNLLACSLLSSSCDSDTAQSCINNISSSDSSVDYHRIVAIGDVHGSLEGLMQVMYQANLTTSPITCTWRPSTSKTLFVQMGDIVDRGPQASEAWQCLDDMQSSAPEGSAVVRLLGNHELFWLMGLTHDRNKLHDTPSKINALVNRMKSDIIAGRVKASHLIWLKDTPIMFVHGGIRPQYTAYMSKEGARSPAEIEKYINDKLVDSMRKCLHSTCGLHDEVFQAGKDRGGNNIGGPFWTDFNVLQRSYVGAAKAEMIQVVGHTMAWCYDPSRPGYHPSRDEAQCGRGLIRATDGLQAVCVDAGMYAGARAYLEIAADYDGGGGRGGYGIVAHELESDGDWSRRDFTQLVCR